MKLHEILRNNKNVIRLKLATTKLTANKAIYLPHIIK